MALSKPKWLYDELTFHESPPKTIKTVVHEIKMADVEDPDLMVAEPIWQWQQTEEGKFIMENSNPAPSWHRTFDVMLYGHVYKIVAYLDEKAYTYWTLKYK